MKKITCFLLVFVMLLGVCSAVSAGQDGSFADVEEGQWYYDAVMWAVEMGVTKGLTETEFGPGGLCTRGQIVTFLYRTFFTGDVIPVGPGADSSFKDIKPADYYYQAVMWAVVNGVTKGLSDTEFGPNAVCTRAQAVTFLWRAFSSTKSGTDASSDGASEQTSTGTGVVAFDDVPEGAYYESAVFWAVENDITKGVSDRLFDPEGKCTRAQIVTFLYRTDAIRHRHVFRYKYDTTCHWQECSCGEAIPSAALHNFEDGICTVCGYSPSDPNPLNLGVSCTQHGVKLSYAVRLDDKDTGLPVPGTGASVHGGHQAVHLRTEYGTFIVEVTDDQIDIGRGEFYVDDIASVYKVTADGCEKLFDFRFPHAWGNCDPTLLRAEDGYVYCILLDDDKNSSDDAALLRIFRIDPKTCKYSEITNVSMPFEVKWVHGYGYSQPCYDPAFNRIYCLFAGGEDPGYTAWFTFDLSTDSWVGGCKTIEMDFRECYYNAYADGKGGFYFVGERDAPAASLERQLGVDFTASGYKFDSCEVFWVKDAMASKPEYELTQTYLPVTYERGERVSPESVAHYNSGTTMVDAKGNLHILYSVSRKELKKSASGAMYRGNVSYLYYAIYDKDMKEIRNAPIQFSASDITNVNYLPIMADDANGNIYYILRPEKGGTIEVWRSSNYGKTQEKLLMSTLQTKDGKVLSNEKLFATYGRNFSLKDNVLGFYCHQKKSAGNTGDYDLYYFSIELP